MKTVLIIAAVAALLMAVGRLYRKGARRWMVAVVDETKCTGCRRCIKKCRRRAIEQAAGAWHVKALVRYPDRCSGCGDCVRSCKFDAIQLVDKRM